MPSSKWLLKTEGMIARDIETYLKKKRMIPKSATVILPAAAIDWEKEDNYIYWTGAFEVFVPDHNTITLDGRFSANTLEGIGRHEDYSLMIVIKGKEHWIYD